MSRSNQCFLIGNLGSDPIERTNKTGSGPIVGFSVAENVQTLDRETQTYKTTHTNWFQITTFGTVAEKAKAALKKGDCVAIQGKMKIAKFTTKSGEEKSAFEIIADDIGIWKRLSFSNSNQSSIGPSELSEIMEDDLPF